MVREGALCTMTDSSTFCHRLGFRRVDESVFEERGLMYLSTLFSTRFV